MPTMVTVAQAIKTKKMDPYEPLYEAFFLSAQKGKANFRCFTQGPNRN